MIMIVRENPNTRLGKVEVTSQGECKFLGAYGDDLTLADIIEDVSKVFPGVDLSKISISLDDPHCGFYLRCSP